MSTIPCPTCGAKDDEVCVRGSKPGVVWEAQIPFPRGHDSRRTANMHRKGTQGSRISYVIIDEIKGEN